LETTAQTNSDRTLQRGKKQLSLDFLVTVGRRAMVEIIEAAWG
jgi:hypothetical protein